MGVIYYVDIETATTKARYEEYVERRRQYDLALKPAKSREERDIMLRSGPKMVHGDDPRRDKIVSIQVQQLTDLGERSPQLYRFHEWDHPQGERGILKEFNDLTGFFDRKWDCAMAGFNLAFEKSWFWYKGMGYGLVPWGTDPNEWERPCIDLHHVAMLFNADNIPPPGMRGDVPSMMVGASLDNFSRKVGKGAAVTRLYHERRFTAIDDYTVQEARSFVELWETLLVEMPQLWKTRIGPAVGRELGKTRVSEALAETDETDERNGVTRAG